MLKMFFNYAYQNNKNTKAFLDEHGYREVPNIDTYFGNVYKKEWFEDEYVKMLVKVIDKTEVIAPGIMDSPILGLIPPTSLSGGVKALILLKHLNKPDIVLNGAFFGDNCAPYILEIAKEKDITLIMHHLIEFGKFTDDVEVLNIPRVCHGYNDYIRACREVLC